MTTRAIFADTAYYLALLSPRDALHAGAVEASGRITGQIVTSAWVMQELADGLAAPPARPAFLRLLDTLQADSQVLIVPVDPNLWREALEFYRQRSDKPWSLTDCTSFLLMKRHDIKEALTADHHFEQAGFTALLG